MQGFEQSSDVSVFRLLQDDLACCIRGKDRRNPLGGHSRGNDPGGGDGVPWGAEDVKLLESGCGWMVELTGLVHRHKSVCGRERC